MEAERTLSGHRLISVFLYTIMKKEGGRREKDADMEAGKMKLKNVLIVVENLECSKKFYHDLFGLEAAAVSEGNMILTEGLVLQEKKGWDSLIGRTSVCGGGAGELYFEENYMDGFLEKLKLYPEPVSCVNPVAERDWGQRVVRIADPDGHVIEVAESENSVVRRLRREGMELEAIKEKTGLPIEQVRGICGEQE